ncbi:hypothetical protein ANO11243_066130 [Dothideomycetidae sp. 11243]|nr:hypothetical protein ANO11243_066130 [fungal sp. No.11243]
MSIARSDGVHRPLQQDSDKNSGISVEEMYGMYPLGPAFLTRNHADDIEEDTDDDEDLLNPYDVPYLPPSRVFLPKKFRTILGKTSYRASPEYLPKVIKAYTSEECSFQQAIIDGFLASDEVSECSSECASKILPETSRTGGSLSASPSQPLPSPLTSAVAHFLAHETPPRTDEDAAQMIRSFTIHLEEARVRADAAAARAEQAEKTNADLQKQIGEHSARIYKLETDVAQKDTLLLQERSRVAKHQKWSNDLIVRIHDLERIVDQLQADRASEP